MDWIIIYLVFALTTSICAWLFYYLPISREALQKGVKNTFTNSPLLSSIVYIVISTFIAPMLFLPLFSETHGKQFRQALREEILKQD
jgi:hypothetical protein